MFSRCGPISILITASASSLLRQAYPNASNVDLIARVTQNVQRAAIND
jgi:hypothetical protein